MGGGGAVGFGASGYLILQPHMTCLLLRQKGLAVHKRMLRGSC
jgi:hypothetical protein